MQGDFTRLTFDSKKHYSSVRMQQGRVQLDADWNEEVDILEHRADHTARDLMGNLGVPAGQDTFKVVESNLEGTELDLKLGQGRFYVDGILCENEEHVWFSGARAAASVKPCQPDLPGNARISKTGVYLLYLRVWQRHLTPLDDDAMREKALGGPDTATRTKTVWQVWAQRLGDTGTLHTCSSAQKALEQLAQATDAQMRAFIQDSNAVATPCILPPTSGFHGLENQLYRVQIHQGGKLTGPADRTRLLPLRRERPLPVGSGPTIIWSRDNASHVYPVTKLSGNEITIANVGRDEWQLTAGEQWVELTNAEKELRGEPGLLLRVTAGPPESNVLTVTGFEGGLETLKLSQPKLRRWNVADGASPIPADGSQVALENRLAVQFDPDKTYHTGDYWLIPARPGAEPDIEWPREGNDAAWMPPHGIRYHFAPLAIIDHTGAANPVIQDCRRFFSALTDVTRFDIIAGDGQDAINHDPLPKPLQVVVMAGNVPLGNAEVEFRTAPPGQIAAHGDGFNAATETKTVKTDADGIARCDWKPDTGAGFAPVQECTATLLNSSSAANRHPALHFTANVNVRQAIDTHGCCYTVGGKSADFMTLENALNQLLAAVLASESRTHAICLCLQAGTHDLDRSMIIDAETAKKLGRKRVSLNISGCGPASIIAVKQPLILQHLESVAIRHCTLIGEETAGLIRVASDVRSFECTGNRIDAKRQIYLKPFKDFLGGLRETAPAIKDLDIFAHPADLANTIDNTVEDLARTASDNRNRTIDRVLRDTDISDRMATLRIQPLHVLRGNVILDRGVRREPELPLAPPAVRPLTRPVPPAGERPVPPPAERPVPLPAERPAEQPVKPAKTDAFAMHLEDTLAELRTPGINKARLKDLLQRLFLTLPGTALVIDDPATRTVLESNDISGDVSFAGAPSTQIDYDDIAWSTLVKYSGGDWWKVHPAGDEPVHIHGNTLRRLLVGSARMEQLLAGGQNQHAEISNAFPSMHVSANHMSCEGVLLAVRVTLVSNLFDGDGQEDVIVVAAAQASIVANVGSWDERKRPRIQNVCRLSAGAATNVGMDLMNPM